jgi:hypothetical protein
MSGAPLSGAPFSCGVGVQEFALRINCRWEEERQRCILRNESGQLALPADSHPPRKRATLNLEAKRCTGR